MDKLQLLWLLRRYDSETSTESNESTDTMVLDILDELGDVIMTSILKLERLVGDK